MGDSTNNNDSNNWFGKIFQATKAVMLLFDASTGGIDDANNAAVQFYGYTKEDLLGSTLWDLDLESDRQARELLNLASSDKENLFERRHRLANGRIRDVEMFTGPLQIGNSTKLYAIIHDITERKEAQEALRKSEERVRSFLESVEDMVYFQGVDGDLSLLNQANETITGYTLEEFNANPQLWRDIVHQDDLKVAEEFFDNHPDGVPYFEVEYRIRSKTGQWKWIHSRMFASRDESGKIIGYHCLDRDVTSLKKAEEMAVQTERLKAVTELASGVAHNFNNLLQIIMSAAQMAEVNFNMNSYKEMGKNLRQITQSSKLGVNTVKRLQEFARLKTSISSRNAEVCDLSELTEQALEMTKPWWKHGPAQEGFTITLEKDLQDGCRVNCVTSEIFEVLVNLIKNAAEAISENGAIKISTRSEREISILTITDTGHGLTEEERNRVFDPFWSKKGIKGVGMGLTMSRGSIIRHGGAIDVHSDGPGKGTTFMVRLPMAQDLTYESSHSGEKNQYPTLKLLLIDDIAPVLDMLKANLERLNQNVISASSGPLGLEKLRSQDVDAIICDYSMPEMSGLEVAAWVKDYYKSKDQPRPPFVLVTGLGGDLPDYSELELIGVDSVVEKPADMTALLDLTLNLVKKNSERIRKAVNHGS